MENSEKDTEELSVAKKIRSFFKSDKFRYSVGVVVLLFTFYVIMALVSFVFTGKEDQSLVLSEDVVMVNLPKEIKNWAGASGAYIAEVMINKWFGLTSFFMTFIGIVIGLRMFGLKIMSIYKAFFIVTFALIWGSLTLSYSLGWFFDGFLHIGGAHGELLNEWLVTRVGLPGTFFIILGAGLLFSIFAISSTVIFLQQLFKIKRKDSAPDLYLPEQQPDILEDNLGSDNALVADDILEIDENEDSTTTEGDDTPITTEITLVQEKEKTYEVEIETVEIEEEPEVQCIAVKTVPDNAPSNENREETIAEKMARLVSEQGLINPLADLPDYKYPELELLKQYPQPEASNLREEQEQNQRKIISTLESFNIKIKKILVTVGPTITLYEIVPEDGIRINKIRNLEPDIMMSLAATGVRIIAPIPGKGTIGIEVPNLTPRIVSMHSIIGSTKFKDSRFDLPIALGRTITNDVFMIDLAKMPHLLVAGATGQGKSVGLNAIITSLLYKKHPSELKFVLIDPKRVEFNIYSQIEHHFLAKLPEENDAVITDTSRVVLTLNSLCKEMDTRYTLLQKAHARNVKEYNERFINRGLNPDNGHHYMPYIVVIVDEFGDLIMTAGKEVEMPIARIAQLARAVGIHMIIATQRPSVNIITGIIKANFPARIAFRVSSQVDSKTILDGSGAQQLVGRGDMLFSQGNDLTRVQCAFVDTPEVEQIAHFIGVQNGFDSAMELPEPDVADGDARVVDVDLTKRDPIFPDAARLCVQTQSGSTSNIQRKFNLGYNRAGRIMDQLEAAGIVGPAEGSKPRQVLVQTEFALEQVLNSMM